MGQLSALYLGYACYFKLLWFLEYVLHEFPGLAPCAEVVARLHLRA